MTKIISVSDDVYERLSAEKGDRSFSETIAEALAEPSRLEDVAGQGMFDPGTYEVVREETRRVSASTSSSITSWTARSLAAG